MSTKFRQLKNDLQELEKDPSSQLNNSGASKTSSSRLSNYILLFAFLATLTFYIGSRFSLPDINIPNPTEIAQSFNEPSDDLLQRMGSWMTEMGYGELSRQELIDLRNEGVTATYTSQIRDVGYTDVTLEQLVELQRADVSATYARMMKELGYDLSVDQLAETRRNGVTANFTSQMMDLGYTIEELTIENLMRLRSVGVTASLAERLINAEGVKPTIEELIRYRISNQ